MNGNRGFFAIILVLLLAAVFSLPLSASAATSPGVKPGNFFYFFDTTFEKIGLFFTFNSEKKVKKALEYADERLAEAEAVANENKPEAVATAMASYQENVSLATAESKEIKDKEKAENLLSTIADNTSKHQEVLAEVYNKVPDEAKKAIEKAIEISIKGREEALKEIQGLKKTVEELQKDIELLKQQGQSDQSKEIEVLRKEVETLKSQQSSQSAKPQVIEKVVEKIVEVPPTTPQKFTTKLSNSEIIEKVKPAVVYIQTSDGSGSGMIMESNGYVLTNAHVVSDVSVAKIKLSDGRLFIGSVVGRDENIDLALLRINADNLPIVVLGDSSIDVLKQGDEVFTLGYPFGLEGDVSFKEGTISRRISDNDATYLETSAEIHSGNSGGPLVNKYGEVVGINTASYGKSIKGIVFGETIKLALPINLVRGLIPDLKTGRNVVLPKITPPSPPSLPAPSPAPTPQPIPAPTPAPSPVTLQTEALEIVAVGVVSDVASARIEWQTNKPTSAKVFISGGGLSSKVYNSESGLSTRHIANITGLVSNTSYSYEIESITGEQVVRKEGSLSTKTGELIVSADKTSIQFTNGHSIGSIRVTAQYTENGKVVPVDITFSTPSDSKTYRITELSVRPCSSYHPFHVQLVGSTGGSCTADGKITFDYAPKSLGIHTISVTAKGVTKSVNIQVTEYVIVDPTVEVLPMHVDGVVMPIPIFDLGNHYGTVGRFKILPEESYSDFTDKQYESDVPYAEYLLWLKYEGNGEYGFKVSAQFIANNIVYKLPTGTYTIVLKGLKVLEQNLGQYRDVSGLPITFTFKVVGQYP